MILITGFEPFGDEATNPSWDAVATLPDAVLGHALHKLRLPVSYGRCFDALHAAIGADCRAVICVGQAGGRTGITPEQVALARQHAGLADGDGVLQSHAPMPLDTAPAYYSTLPNAAMVDAMRAAGIPAAISYHAGTYVCNTLLYRLMQYIEAEDLPMLGGFIHVPFASEQVAARENPPASLPLATIAEGLLLCVKAAAAALDG